MRLIAVQFWKPGDLGILRGDLECVSEEARTRGFASLTLVRFAFVGVRMVIPRLELKSWDARIDSQRRVSLNSKQLFTLTTARAVSAIEQAIGEKAYLRPKLNWNPALTAHRSSNTLVSKFS